MRLISLFGDGVVPFIITPIVAYFISKKDKKIAILLLASVILGVLAKEFFESLVQADRPSVFGCEVLTSHAGGYSFPSGHVNYYVIFFGILIYFSRIYIREQWSKYLIGFSAIMIGLIGYSRYYLGAHWIADIIAGYIFGGLVLWGSLKIYRLYLKKIGQTRVLDGKGKIQKAGVVVVRQKGKKRDVLLVYRKKQNDYSFPKGHIEQGETAQRAALRELREETGLVAKIGKKLPPVYYEYPEGDGRVKVSMYAAVPIKFKIPTSTMEKTYWVPFNKVKKTLTHKNLKEFWDKIKDKI